MVALTRLNLDRQIIFSEIVLSLHPFFCSDRAVARRQIEELGSFGYRIYFAPENEFFLASKENLSKPFFDGDDWGANILADGLKSYIFDVIRKAKAARIQVEAWHIEYNPGQVEITLEPEMGLQAADNWLVFRQGVKETALLHGLTATFMSKPFMIDETGSGSHFNHSIWTHGGENAFWNPEAEDNLSEFARHWVAGLLAHAPAMTALCNPTVNCYRRLHIHFTPHLVNWGIDNRTTLVRVKNHSQDSTFAEGRLPSSAANPYIVIAAYIAAGMDGVKRKLPLPEKADRKATKLPVSLPEAIKALTSDKILIEAMGKKFMELFFKIKEIELRSLGATADVNDESVFAREREIYMKLI